METTLRFISGIFYKKSVGKTLKNRFGLSLVERQRRQSKQ